MRIERQDAQPFALVTVDLSEYSTLFQSPMTMTFIGYKADSTTVTQSFTTDGVMDGTGPQADFETFTFVGFNDLLYVETTDQVWAMDNLVTSVPEPGVVALMVLGLAGLGFLSRRSVPSAS